MRGTVLQLTLGIALLGLVGAQVDLGKVVVYARQVGPFDLALATACLVLQHLLKGKRWQLILASQRLQYGFGEAQRMYWSALFIGVVTPGRLGELSRLAYLKQDGVPLGQAMAGVIVDRLLDLIVMMVMVGLGGVTAELFKDVVYRPAPVSVQEAGEMLNALKGASLLNGFRGAAQADVSAASRLIAQVSQLAEQLKGEVAEIELNPVCVHPAGEGVTIVDALVVRR